MTWDPLVFARRMAKAKPTRPVGVADRAIVVLLEGRVWRVAGGDVDNPSLIHDPRIGINTVKWVVRPKL